KETLRRDTGNKALAALAIVVSIALGVGIGSLIGFGHDSGAKTVVEPVKALPPAKATNTHGSNHVSGQVPYCDLRPYC
ncbi:MAG TPA: hypothetical protein VFJ64_03050, partial [Solirubrobacterales bacterium]|nr:hypothetical protein [Solirubrobacterales bacterium]